MKRLFILFVLLALPCPCEAWPGTVLSIQDGDTLTVAPLGDAETPVRVRLYGIDAPEGGQPGGKESTARLPAMTPVGDGVEIIPMGMDQYDRVLGLVMVAGRCINRVMLEDGHAWHYTKYCRASMCNGWRKAQDRAIEERRGLWGTPDPVPPWEWRKRKR